MEAIRSSVEVERKRPVRTAIKYLFSKTSASVKYLEVGKD